MRVRQFQCWTYTSASGPATPHNIENYSNELLYMLSGYFKTSMLNFVQQLIKTCAYINIYKACIGHSDSSSKLMKVRRVHKSRSTRAGGLKPGRATLDNSLSGLAGF